MDDLQRVAAQLLEQRLHLQQRRPRLVNTAVHQRGNRTWKKAT